MASGSVGLGEVIGYGFKLMGFMILIGLVAAVFAVPGTILATGALTDGDGAEGGLQVLGFALVVIGGLVYLAGNMGLQFKVISDGVSRGIPRTVNPPGSPARRPEPRHEQPQPGSQHTPGTP